MNEPLTEETMSQEEWLYRYKARIIDEADVTEECAQECAAAAPFAELSKGWENDPEGAADEELSYWTDDGDE